MSEKHSSARYRDADYLAWIPCVSGRLLFRYLTPFHVKKTLNSSPVVVKEIKGKKYTAVYFDTDIKDTEKETGTGKFHVLVTLDQSDKIGEIYNAHVLLWEKSDDTDFAYHTKEKLFELRNLGEEENTNPTDWITGWNELIMTVTEDKSQRYETSLTIEGNGLCYVDKPIEAEDGNYTPLDADIEKLVVDQSFFALKQLLHKHKHHHPGDHDDSITQPHLISECINKFGEKNLGIPLVHDLKTSLIDFNRAELKNYEQLHGATGLASYTKSLIESLRCKKLITAKRAFRENVYIDNTLSSINITVDQKVMTRERKANAWANFRVWLLALFATIAPATFLLRSTIVENLSRACEEDILDFYARPLVVLFENPMTLGLTLLCILLSICLLSLPRLGWPEPAVKLEEFFNLTEQYLRFNRRDTVCISALLLIMGFMIITATMSSSIKVAYKYTPPDTCLTNKTRT